MNILVRIILKVKKARNKTDPIYVLLAEATLIPIKRNDGLLERPENT